MQLLKASQDSKFHGCAVHELLYGTRDSHLVIIQLFVFLILILQKYYFLYLSKFINVPTL